MAVNKQRGENEIEIDGKRYVSVMDLEAMARLEDHWSEIEGKTVTFADVMDGAGRGSIKYARSVLWASLLRYQPSVTIADVSVLTFVELKEIQTKLLTSMQPDAEDRKDAKKGRPHKAQVNGAAGTGAISKSKLDASA